MKPTNYLRYVVSATDPFGHNTHELLGETFFYLEQWWERERTDPVPTAPGEWRRVEMENYDGGQPPAGWTPSCQ